METDSLEESDENKTDEQVSKATDVLVKKPISFSKQLEVSDQDKTEEKLMSLNLSAYHADDEILAIYQIKFKAALKRNKTLNVLVQKQRTQIKNLLGELGTLTSQINSTTPLDEEKDELLKVVTIREKQMLKLEEELSSLKLQRVTWQTKNKKLENIIRKEVGTDFSVDHFETTDSWRGRAQTISLLHNKLSNLRTELDDLKEENSSSKCQNQKAQAEADIFSQENKLKESKLELVEKHKNIENKFQASVEKNKSLKARNSSIEHELRRTKDQLAVLRQKNTNDDILIQSLSRDVSAFRNQVSALREQSRGSVPESDLAKILDENKSLQNQLSQRDDDFVVLRVDYNDLKEKFNSIQNNDIDEVVHQVNLKLTNVENDRLNEMLDLFKRKFEEQTAENQGLHYRLQVLDGKLYESQKRNGNLSINPKRRLTGLNEVQDLKLKLKKTMFELKKTRFNSSEQIAVKSEEARILRAMNEEMRRAYEDAILQMKDEIRLRVMNQSFSNNKLKNARKKARRNDALRLPNITQAKSPSAMSKHSYSNIHGGRPTTNCFLTNPN